jgi:hypothetical protein
MNLTATEVKTREDFNMKLYWEIDYVDDTSIFLILDEPDDSPLHWAFFKTKHHAWKAYCSWYGI